MDNYYKVKKWNMIFKAPPKDMTVNKDRLLELLKTSSMYKFEIKCNDKNKSLIKELKSDGLISDEFEFEKTVYLNWCNNKLEIN